MTKNKKKSRTQSTKNRKKQSEITELNLLFKILIILFVVVFLLSIFLLSGAAGYDYYPGKWHDDFFIGK